MVLRVWRHCHQIQRWAVRFHRFGHAAMGQNPGSIGNTKMDGKWMFIHPQNMAPYGIVASQFRRLKNNLHPELDSSRSYKVVSHLYAHWYSILEARDLGLWCEGNSKSSLAIPNDLPEMCVNSIIPNICIYVCIWFRTS